ncbi:MAG: hypothetical protein LBP92_02870 [Deltaproteobacteria bacterium]|jgi:hypothetical protein|nr:hypothetical protein [Deltaproteobacteria bacterium]
MTHLLQEFTVPKFTGPRFESHALPVDVIRDLTAYENLLIELAKKLYLQDNPIKQRIPKGFSDVHLAILKIENGSLSPALALMTSKDSFPPMPTPSANHEDSYYRRAHDLIVECIASPDDDIPKEFPKEFLSYFNQFGRSLKDNETLQLSRIDNTKTAVLTQNKRKNLVLTINHDYEREIYLYGSIIRAYQDKKTLLIQQEDGSKIYIPFQKKFKHKLGDFFGSKRNIIFVSGIGSFDSADKLKKVNTIYSIEFIKNYKLTTIFEDLAQLNDGWCNGEGLALNNINLQSIANIFIENFPEFLPLPLISPTYDGNLLLEWNIKGFPSIDINISLKNACYQAFGLNNEDDLFEAEFNLNTQIDITNFFNFLSKHIK